MKDLGLYISELLSKHDCVIVPGFGGFVARPAPAHFSKAGGLLMPPGKSLVFNKNLDNSDGLLAHHIAQKRSITYREATDLLEKWVATSKQILDTQKRLELETTGILYFSPEHTLLFEPALTGSLQVSSFGLAPVTATLLVPKQDEKVADEKVYRVGSDEKAAGGRVLTRISVVVSSVLLFAFLVFLTARQLPIAQSLASLNPFASKGTGYEPKSYGLGTIFSGFPERTPEIKNNIALKSETGSIKVFVVSPDTVVVDKTKVTKVVRMTSGAANYNAPFQIVVGCFAVEQNANKLIDQLEKENIPAGISGRNARGLYVVSVAGFTTESLARTKLEQVKQRFPSAWILVK